MAAIARASRSRATCSRWSAPRCWSMTTWRSSIPPTPPDGAAAEAGADLYECKALGGRVNANTASMGVALTSCTVPEADAPTFEVDPSEMEVGVGIHGEPGRYRRSLMPADDIVALLLEPILKDLALAAGRPVLLHVNGF